jgi:hypothetical protein
MSGIQSDAQKRLEALQKIAAGLSKEHEKRSSVSQGSSGDDVLRELKTVQTNVYGSIELLNSEVERLVQSAKVSELSVKRAYIKLGTALNAIKGGFVGGLKPYLSELENGLIALLEKNGSMEDISVNLEAFEELQKIADAQLQQEESKERVKQKDSTQPSSPVVLTVEPVELSPVSSPSPHSSQHFFKGEEEEARGEVLEAEVASTARKPSSLSGGHGSSQVQQQEDDIFGWSASSSTPFKSSVSGGHGSLQVQQQEEDIFASYGSSSTPFKSSVSGGHGSSQAQQEDDIFGWHKGSESDINLGGDSLTDYTTLESSAGITGISLLPQRTPPPPLPTSPRPKSVASSPAGQVEHKQAEITPVMFLRKYAAFMAEYRQDGTEKQALTELAATGFADAVGVTDETLQQIYTAAGNNINWKIPEFDIDYKKYKDITNKVEEVLNRPEKIDTLYNEMDKAMKGPGQDVSASSSATSTK